MSTESKKSDPAAPTRRTSDEIRADLDAVKAKQRDVHRTCTAQWEYRQKILLLHAVAAQKWRADPVTAEMPFDPALLPHLPAVPPVETPETLALHRLGYEITRLEKELDAAKKAETTF